MISKRNTCIWLRQPGYELRSKRVQGHRETRSPLATVGSISEDCRQQVWVHRAVLIAGPPELVPDEVAIWTRATKRNILSVAPLHPRTAVAAPSHCHLISPDMPPSATYFPAKLECPAAPYEQLAVLPAAVHPLRNQPILTSRIPPGAGTHRGTPLLKHPVS